VSDIINLILKTLSFIITYLIKQRLLEQKVKIEHIVYILILMLWTRPVLHDALKRQELVPFLDELIDYLIMIFITLF
jgi:hypothetical protein